MCITKLFGAVLVLLLSGICSVAAQTPTLALTQSGYTFDEGDGTVQLCVEIRNTGTGNGLDADLTVGLNLGDGSSSDAAMVSMDYSAGPLQVTFASGATAGSTSCADLIIIDDADLEETEMFIVFLAFTSDFMQDPPSNAPILIEDNDDDPMINLTMSAYSTMEGMTLSVCMQVENSFAFPLESDITATLSTMDGSKAAEGMDFIATTPLEVTFPSSSVEGATACVDFSVIDDNILEGDHDFTVEIDSVQSVTTPVMITMPSSAPVTISDNDDNQNTGCVTVVTVVIVAIVSSLPSFATGVVAGGLVCYWFTRKERKSQCVSCPKEEARPSVYEDVGPPRGDIEMIENVAYGPVRNQ